jgi:hypothetical protein
LSANATVSTTTIDNWLGAVTNWAENEVLQLFAGVVSQVPSVTSSDFLIRLTMQSASFYANSLAFTESDIIPYDGIQKLFQYIQDAPKDTPAWFIIFDLEGGAVRVFLYSLIID